MTRRRVKRGLREIHLFPLPFLHHFNPLHLFAFTSVSHASTWIRWRCARCQQRRLLLWLNLQLTRNDAGAVVCLTDKQITQSLAAAFPRQDTKAHSDNCTPLKKKKSNLSATDNRHYQREWTGARRFFCCEDIFASHWPKDCFHPRTACKIIHFTF